MIKNSKIHNWLIGRNNSISSESYIYAHVNNPSVADIINLLDFLLDESGRLYLQYEDSPDSETLCQNVSRVSEGLWNIHKGIDAGLMLDKWLYAGNWMASTSNLDKPCNHSYSFKNISEFLSELMSNENVTSGVISFHDNSELWVFTHK